MESEKRIGDGLRRETDELDLVADVEPGAAGFDLVRGEAGFAQQRRRVDPRRLDPRIGEPGDRPVRGEERAQMLAVEITPDFRARAQPTLRAGWHTPTMLWRRIARRARKVADINPHRKLGQLADT